MVRRCEGKKMRGENKNNRLLIIYITDIQIFFLIKNQCNLCNLWLKFFLNYMV
jgi:hypothetical protein